MWDNLLPSHTRARVDGGEFSLRVVFQLAWPPRPHSHDAFSTCLCPPSPTTKHDPAQLGAELELLLRTFYFERIPLSGAKGDHVGARAQAAAAGVLAALPAIEDIQFVLEHAKELLPDDFEALAAADGGAHVWESAQVRAGGKGGWRGGEAKRELLRFCVHFVVPQRQSQPIQPSLHTRLRHLF